ncbi:MAG: Glycogen operon protein GlgX [Chlamydiia bacterium]|nr:Glycogen operon protein GlgX [Chlamydiia bacterium]
MSTEFASQNWPAEYPGVPHPLGISYQNGLVNFAFWTNHNNLTLKLFAPGARDPFWEKRLDPHSNKTDSTWHISLNNLAPNTEYAITFDGCPSPFADPYAKALSAGKEWNQAYLTDEQRRAKIPPPDTFDWAEIKSPNRPREELVIYEMHVRGFTQSPSSMTTAPGTFAGITEKIHYLKSLGINAVELMPVFEFNEFHEPLPNYWGYCSLNFFSPMNRFAKGNPIDEFKQMVKTLHANGIEVILDVVYNHTTKTIKATNHYSTPSPLAMFDAHGYFMLDQEGHDTNYSGCGNTLSPNSPPMTQLILDSLRYWAQEMHVDGFRFDLASVLFRDPSGTPIDNPPILEQIQNDPILSTKKLIAEPWDAAGLQKLGLFPHGWSDWNGHFRDSCRKFLKGDPNTILEFIDALLGSPSFYHSHRGPSHSVNFITAHDGFTLNDLVSYNHKHNEANLEESRDGDNNNNSWNCGEEGPTSNPEIQALRLRQMKNFFLALFISPGIPMLRMGDEYGHTADGNNNPWNQDNPLNHFDWKAQGENQHLTQFVQKLISLRKQHPPTQDPPTFYTPEGLHHTPSPSDPHLIFTTNHHYIAFNPTPHPIKLTLPKPHYTLQIATQETSPEPIPLQTYILAPYSALLAST